MNNINIRNYIINNFKDNSIDEIKNSIETSIDSGEEEVLIGLGVLFEILYNNTSDKNNIIKTIKDNL